MTSLICFTIHETIWTVSPILQHYSYIQTSQIHKVETLINNVTNQKNSEHENRFYKQTAGFAMDAPTSSLLAERNLINPLVEWYNTVACHG